MPPAPMAFNTCATTFASRSRQDRSRKAWAPETEQQNAKGGASGASLLCRQRLQTVDLLLYLFHRLRPLQNLGQRKHFLIHGREVGIIRKLLDELLVFLKRLFLLHTGAQ